jgi:hypothetical protein
MYTLKVDWHRQRIHAVHRALTAQTAPTTLRHPSRDLSGYLDVDDTGATLKLDWSPQQIAAVQAALAARMDALAADMLRARVNDPGVPSYRVLVAEQTQLAAAARDIRDYQAALSEATSAMRPGR